MFQIQPAVKTLISVAAIGMLAITSGCGSSSSVGNLVSNVQASTSTQNGDIWASLSADLNFDGFTLAGLNLPIVDPSNPSLEYGSIALAPTLCSGSSTTCVSTGQLTLSIDLTAVAKVPSTTSTLPNGTAIPISGLSSVVALAIGNTGGKIYLDLSNTTAVLGVAFPFEALNTVGEYVPGLDLFDSVAFGDVTAFVGIFAGSATDQTGVALFVDLSKVLNPSTSTSSSTTTASSSGSSSSTVAANAMVANAQPVSPEFQDLAPAKLQSTSHSMMSEYELLTRMQTLAQKHTVLKLQ